MTERAVRTLAIRLDEGLHAQLVVLAGLDGLTITDLIRGALEAHLQQRRAAGDLEARAGEALAEIEREATARRAAIEALFGSTADKTPAKPRNGRRAPAE